MVGSQAGSHHIEPIGTVHARPSSNASLFVISKALQQCLTVLGGQEPAAGRFAVSACALRDASDINMSCSPRRRVDYRWCDPVVRS